MAQVAEPDPSETEEEVQETETEETDPPTPPEETPEGKFSREYVERLRNEAAKHRTKAKETAEQLKAAETKVKEFEQAQLSDQERVQEQLKELAELKTELEGNLTATQTALRNTLVENAVVRASVDLNIVDPDAAYRLLDREDLEFDDQGRPTNVKEALETLVESRQYLVGTKPKPKVDPTNPPKTEQGKITRDALASMSHDDINARWDEIKAQLSAGPIR